MFLLLWTDHLHSFFLSLKYRVYKNWCNCPRLSSSCPPWSHTECRTWCLWQRKAGHRQVLAVFTVSVCLPSWKHLLGARLEVSVWLNEPEPFDWRGESSALILFCLLQSFAQSSVLRVLHTHSEWWKSQQEVLEDPSFGLLSVFGLQIGQQCVTVSAKPSWLSLACASLVQDKP